MRKKQVNAVYEAEAVREEAAGETQAAEVSGAGMSAAGEAAGEEAPQAAGPSQAAGAEQSAGASRAEAAQAAGEEQAGEASEEIQTGIPEGAGTGNLTYIGPSIQNLIQHGTTFAGGVLPPRVRAAVEELPVAAKLFVPLEELPGAVKSLGMKNSVLAEVSDRMARRYSKR